MSGGEAAPSPGGEPPPLADDGEVAGAALLRRVAWMASIYGLGAGAAFAAAADWRRGLSLTAAAAVSIVALRSLEGVIGRLRAVAGEAAPALGWHHPLRLFLLVGLVILLLVTSRDGLAVVLGLSAVPLAFIVEAGLQLVSPSRPR